MEHFFKGQKVTYTYRHWLNSRSSTIITKEGHCVRHIRDRKTGNIIHGDTILVQFKGNKTLSRVKLKDLKPVH